MVRIWWTCHWLVVVVGEIGIYAFIIDVVFVKIVAQGWHCKRNVYMAWGTYFDLDVGPCVPASGRAVGSS
jgi:hypothetical protein